MLHAWYSDRHAELFGTIIYAMPGGGTVEVTAVNEDPNYCPEHYIWDDAIYVGEVSDFVSKGRIGSHAQLVEEKVPLKELHTKLKLGESVTIQLDPPTSQVESFARLLLGNAKKTA